MDLTPRESIQEICYQSLNLIRWLVGHKVTRPRWMLGGDIPGERIGRKITHGVWEAFGGLPPWETEPVMLLNNGLQYARSGVSPSFSHRVPYFLHNLIGFLGWWWGSPDLLRAVVGGEGSVQPPLTSVTLRATWFPSPSSGFLIHYIQREPRNLYLFTIKHRTPHICPPRPESNCTCPMGEAWQSRLQHSRASVSALVLLQHPVTKSVHFHQVEFCAGS